MEIVDPRVDPALVVILFFDAIAIVEAGKNSFVGRLQLLF